MKKLLFALLVISIPGLFSSCKDDSKIPAPDVTSVPLIFATVSSEASKSSFDFSRSRATATELLTLTNPTRPVFEFSFDITNQRDVKLQAVEVYKSFKRGISIGPRVLVGSYDSFPATVSLNSQDALTGLQRFLVNPGTTLPVLDNLISSDPTRRNTILSSDVIVFTFEYVLQDGSRVILTPLSDVKLLGGGTAKVISGTQINPPYSLYATFTTL